MATAARLEVLYEGWLTKSPPTKRVWKPKWRRRWFTLRNVRASPPQYVLDYYTDKNSSKLKGTIDLDLCVQIDSGLQMPKRNKNDSSPKGSVFSIKTSTRVYHLQADSVVDAQKWVEVICKACGMLPTTDVKFFPRNSEGGSDKDNPQNSNLYIPISECISGPPYDNQDNLTAYKNWNGGMLLNDFYRNNFFSTNKYTVNNERTTSVVSYKKYVQDGSVAEELQRSPTISSHSNGPPAPPRPPKPSHLCIESHKDGFVGPRVHEPVESVSYQGPTHSNMYCNLQEGPIVDRKLKPRGPLDLRFRTRNGSIHHSYGNSAKLQYLDLDLVPSSSVTKKRTESSPTNYKKVDFLKTKALSMTRDEAGRRNDPPSAKVD